MHLFRSIPLFRSLIAALLLMPAAASAGIATIGPDAGCDYVATGANNPIAQALMDGKRDLRVVAGTLNAGGAAAFITSAHPALNIRGGYADCAAAAANTRPAPTARSRWRASAGQSLFAAVSFGPDRGEFALSGFTLEPAPAPATLAPNGGALVVAGPIDARIENMDISGFQAVDRGGALMLGTDAAVRLVNTKIYASAASRGGGIACEQAMLLLDADTRIYLNEAIAGASPEVDAGRGGGIYLANCVLFSEARADSMANPGSGGIAYNRAGASGGGIAARDSRISLLGGSGCVITPAAHCRETLATLIGNAAGEDGGGIHADNSTVGLYMAEASDNTAGRRGGGFAGVNDTYLSLIGSGEGDGMRAFCERNGGCARMRNNRAGSAGFPGAGGAIALDASEMISEHAVFENNLASLGSALALVNASYGLIFQSVVSQRIATPGQPFHSMMLMGWNSGLSMVMSSAILDGVAAPEAPGMLALADGAGFGVYYSVLFSRAAPLFSAQPAAGVYEAVCNAVSDAGLLATMDAVQIGPQDFENPAQPLRPARNGAMVDACQEVSYPDETDIEGYPRVTPTIPGREATPQDAGAFEVQGDVLFSDGFEATGPV